MAKRKPTKLDIYRALPRPLFMYVLVVLIPWMSLDKDVGADKLFYIIAFATSIFGIREVGKVFRSSRDTTEFYPDEEPTNDVSRDLLVRDRRDPDFD